MIFYWLERLFLKLAYKFAHNIIFCNSMITIVLLQRLGSHVVIFTLSVSQLTELVNFIIMSDWLSWVIKKVLGSKMLA